MRRSGLPPNGGAPAAQRSKTLGHIAKATEDLAALASGIEAPSLVHLLSLVIMEARELQEEERQVAAIEHLPQ